MSRALSRVLVQALMDEGQTDLETLLALTGASYRSVITTLKDLKDDGLCHLQSTYKNHEPVAKLYSLTPTGIETALAEAAHLRTSPYYRWPTQ